MGPHRPGARSARVSAGHARRNLMFRPQRGAFRPRRSVNCDRVGQRLHMGEEGLTGMGAGFPRDSAISRHRSRRADALPCAQTPLYAHGSTSTNFDGPGRTVESQRKPAASLLGSLSPMCEPPPGQGFFPSAPGCRPNSVRRHHQGRRPSSCARPVTRRAQGSDRHRPTVQPCGPVPTPPGSHRSAGRGLPARGRARRRFAHGRARPGTENACSR
mgnify:CR=1 FL=1